MITEIKKNVATNLLIILIVFFAVLIIGNDARTENVTIGASVPAVCGNSLIEGSETCDDGNTASGDGCSSSCQTETGGGGGPIPVCVSNGSCSAVAPACGQTTSGVDNCGNACVKTGSICQCVSDGSCSATTPACEQTTSGVDNCGTACTKTGAKCECVLVPGSCNAPAPTCKLTTTSGKDNCGNDCTKSIAECACVPDGSCNAVTPTCDQTTTGVNNCGSSCTKTGSKCQCVPNPDTCNAPFPSCGQTTEGKDNCGNACTKSGSSCAPEGPPAAGNGEPQGTGGNNGGSGGGSGDGGGGGIQEDLSPIIAPVVNTINENVVKPIAEQIKKISEIKQVKDVTETVINNVKSISKNFTSASKATTVEINKIIKQVEVISNNPEVQQATKAIAAPTTIVVSVAVAVPSLWSIVFPLARFLFLQPILVLGRRKRKDWGEIYNSLTKLPVDLATVKLIDAKTNNVVRSRVTDTSGRYLLAVPPGEYRLEIIKNNFTFPSSLLKDINLDGERVDIYHGEVLKVTEGEATITANVPIDPSGADRTPRRIFWEKRLHILQHVISIAGIIMTAAYTYIAPTWYVIAFLCVHVIMYAVFYFYATPKRPKGWGIVYEGTQKNPINKAIARLFSKQYDKLVATEITDNKGRYAFLAGPNDYYVMVEKEGYESSTKEITIQQNDPYIVKEDVTLKKGDKV